MKRLLLILLLLTGCLTAAAQEIIHLPSTKATLEAYPAEGATRAAIVCPGGSYYWLDYKHEGIEVAQWLQSQGISAYVLRYHVAGWWAWATHYRLLFKGMQTWEPGTDADIAVNYLWDSLGLRNIGIIGFSAGGHLAMTAAGSNLRYSWAAPIYPVVSMEAPCTHRRSRRALLGDRNQHNLDWQKTYSIEQNGFPTSTPVFLVACKDDPVVDYHNSLLLDSALSAMQIAHRFILYDTGGHGFAVRSDKGTPECHAWKEEFLQWLGSIPTTDRQ
jgi:acetyl esterase/lipase